MASHHTSLPNHLHSLSAPFHIPTLTQPSFASHPNQETMRSVSAFMALSFVAGVSGFKSTYRGGHFVDPTENTIPTYSAPMVDDIKTSFSYYPNDFQCTAVANCTCGGSGEPACGPLNWPYVTDSTLVTCLPETGGQQTPINLDGFEKGYESLTKAEGRMKFTGGQCAGIVEKKKGTYEIVFDEEACKDQSPKPFTVTVDGETWNLWQIHVHAPSEHTVNGKANAFWEDARCKLSTALLLAGGLCSSRPSECPR